MSDVVKVGDTVVWRGEWGGAEPKTARVVSTFQASPPHLICGPDGGKEIEFPQRVKTAYVLDNGNWCYAEQISKGV